MKTFRNPVADFDTPDPFMTYDKVILSAAVIPRSSIALTAKRTASGV